MPHNELVVPVAAVADGIMDCYLVRVQISNAALCAAIRMPTINLEFYPVLAGSAFCNCGVQMLLDAVIATLPSPLDVRPYHATDPALGDAVAQPAGAACPFAALAFMLATAPFVGR